MPEGALGSGPDGRPRCWWALSSADYLPYHDDEWGRPVVDERGMFERISLEAFQSGLSWLTILRKREAFRAAFADFEPERVATFGESDVERLLADAGIVRNRAKILATIANATAIRGMHADGESLAEFVWSFAPERQPAPREVDDLPGTTEESRRLAAALKQRGFRFVGPTTAYAAMQACGIVNDHVEGCVVRAECEAARRSALQAAA